MGQAKRNVPKHSGRWKLNSSTAAQLAQCGCETSSAHLKKLPRQIAPCRATGLPITASNRVNGMKNCKLQSSGEVISGSRTPGIDEWTLILAPSSEDNLMNPLKPPGVRSGLVM